MVVVVNVPFSSQASFKRRPALVLSGEEFHRSILDLIICPISSQERFHRRPGPGDVPLAQWKSVGLKYASTARLSNLLAVEKRLVERVLGPLAPEDMEKIKRILRRVFGL